MLKKGKDLPSILGIPISSQPVQLVQTINLKMPLILLYLILLYPGRLLWSLQPVGKSTCVLW